MNDDEITTIIHWVLQDILQSQISGKIAAWNITLLIDLGNGKVSFNTLTVPPECFEGDKHDKK